jgi:hypothetical protein
MPVRSGSYAPPKDRNRRRTVPRRLAPRPWSHTAFPAPPAFTSATLAAPMTIFRRRSSSTTRRAMLISPTDSATITASQRKPMMPSRCGGLGESTRLGGLPNAPSPTPGRQPMLRQRLCAHVCGVAGACSVQPRSRRDLQPSIGRYRVSIRSPSLVGRLGNISARLGKVVRRCRSVEPRRDASRHRHRSGAG